PRTFYAGEPGRGLLRGPGLGTLKKYSQLCAARVSSPMKRFKRRLRIKNGLIFLLLLLLLLGPWLRRIKKLHPVSKPGGGILLAATIRLSSHSLMFIAFGGLVPLFLLRFQLR